MVKGIPSKWTEVIYDLHDKQYEQMMRRINQNRIRKSKYQMQKVNSCSLQKAWAWTLSPKMKNIWVMNSKLKHNKCCFGESFISPIVWDTNSFLRTAYRKYAYTSRRKIQGCVCRIRSKPRDVHQTVAHKGHSLPVSVTDCWFLFRIFYFKLNL